MWLHVSKVAQMQVTHWNSKVRNMFCAAFPLVFSRVARLISSAMVSFLLPTFLWMRQRHWRQVVMNCVHAFTSRARLISSCQPIVCSTLPTRLPRVRARWVRRERVSVLPIPTRYRATVCVLVISSRTSRRSMPSARLATRLSSSR